MAADKCKNYVFIFYYIPGLPRGNALQPYFGGAKFESKPRHQLS